MNKKLSVKGFAAACAVLWGGAVLLVAVLNIIFSGYGQNFLELIASIYPGYYAEPNVSLIFLVTFYALVDGAIGGAVFALIYNFFARGEKGNNP